MEVSVPIKWLSLIAKTPRDKPMLGVNLWNTKDSSQEQREGKDHMQQHNTLPTASQGKKHLIHAAVIKKTGYVNWKQNGGYGFDARPELFWPKYYYSLVAAWCAVRNTCHMPRPILTIPPKIPSPAHR